jgi:hypothetical protein
MCWYVCVCVCGESHAEDLGGQHSKSLKLGSDLEACHDQEVIIPEEFAALPCFFLCGVDIFAKGCMQKCQNMNMVVN